jgi:hypothetical protein
MSTRLGLALGLAAALGVAAWWLAASRVAIEGGVDPLATASTALFVLGLLRAMLLAVVAPRAAAVGGYLAGLRMSVPIVSAAWPLVVLAWAASAVSVQRALTVETALLVVAAIASAIGRALARGLRQGPWMEALATATGVAVACCIWLIAMRAASS